ncbi:hypothetical protein Scep_023929 [Stephania cephalantha]|uniref:Uncharacterized protein n=1 Tax=Stephania cephalantha TaxID=152367 RepID=A0AAP0HXX0_9MAGN
MIHLPAIFATSPSSSNHILLHSDHSTSSSRYWTPSPTISAPPSTASPVPYGGSHEAVRSFARAPRGHNRAPHSPLPRQLPQHYLRGGRSASHIPYIQCDPLIYEDIVKAVCDAMACKASANFKDKPEKESHNRKKENDNPSTGLSIWGKGFENIEAKDFHYEARRVQAFRAEPVRNTHELQSEHLSSTTTTNTSGASLEGRMDRAHSSVQQHDNDGKDIQKWLDKEHLGDESWVF